MNEPELTEEEELAITRRLYEGLCRKQRRLADRHKHTGENAVSYFFPVMVRYAEKMGAYLPEENACTAVAYWLFEDGPPVHAHTEDGQIVGFICDGAMRLQRKRSIGGECYCDK